MKRKFNIFSDGGSINNGKKDKNKPCFGAYAYVILDENFNVQNETVRVFKDVTNNFCELGGALNGIVHLMKEYPNDELEIDLFTDSQYVVKGINEWIEGWIKRGWCNNEGKPTKNRDLWVTLYDIFKNNERINLTFNWHRGHQGKNISLDENKITYYQERCDTLLSEKLNLLREKNK